MSFGIKKYGVNNTDKKLIKRYVAAGWPLDKISNKLSVHAPVVQGVINRQAKETKPVAAAVAETPATAVAEVEVVAETEADDPPKEPTAAEKKALRKAAAAATAGESSD